MSGPRRLPIIAPSLLSADFLRLGEEIRALEEAGADWIHLDVMDGRFVPNISLGVPVVEACRRATQLPLDVHLMIVEPERYVEAFAEAGATYLTVHAEATVHLHRAVQRMRELGVHPGVALNPATPLVSVEGVLDDLDLVLLMTVNPGFGGQAYIEGMEGKIAGLRSMRRRARTRALIEVDGGIKADNARKVVQAGAEVLVSGSWILGQRPGYQRAIAMMRRGIGSRGRGETTTT